MSDPRLAVIERRFRSIERIIAFASGKGGVGKSCCSAVSSLLLAKQGLRTGLLDLDFHGATDHIILGIDPHLPEEQGGVLPIEGPYSVRYMGIAPFTAEHGVALRGDAVTDAIRELLAVVVWGELDVLVIDMPPGIGEAVLDLSRYLRQSEVVLVTTPSTLSRRIAARLAEVLTAAGMRVGGYLSNMVGPRTESQNERQKDEASPERLYLPGVDFLGEIPYFGELEDEIGDPDRLVAGRFASALSSTHAKLRRP